MMMANKDAPIIPNSPLQSHLITGWLQPQSPVTGIFLAEPAEATIQMANPKDLS